MLGSIQLNDDEILGTFEKTFLQAIKQLWAGCLAGDENAYHLLMQRGRLLSGAEREYLRQEVQDALQVDSSRSLAQVTEGYLRLFGIGVPRDASFAKKCFQEANCPQGFAALYWGMVKNWVHGTPEEKQKYLALAKNNVLTKYVIFDEENSTIEKLGNIPPDKEWERILPGRDESPFQGYSPALNVLGHIYYRQYKNITHDPQDLTLAVENFKKSAILGNPYAVYNLSALYVDRLNGVPDLQKARSYLLVAGIAGHPVALQSLSRAPFPPDLRLAALANKLNSTEFLDVKRLSKALRSQSEGDYHRAVLMEDKQMLIQLCRFRPNTFMKCLKEELDPSLVILPLLEVSLEVADIFLWHHRWQVNQGLVDICCKVLPKALAKGGSYSQKLLRFMDVLAKSRSPVKQLIVRPCFQTAAPVEIVAWLEGRPGSAISVPPKGIEDALSYKALQLEFIKLSDGGFQKLITTLSNFMIVDNENKTLLYYMVMEKQYARINWLLEHHSGILLLQAVTTLMYEGRFKAVRELLTNALLQPTVKYEIKCLLANRTLEECLLDKRDSNGLTFLHWLIKNSQIHLAGSIIQVGGWTEVTTPVAESLLTIKNKNGETLKEQAKKNKQLEALVREKIGQLRAHRQLNVLLNQYSLPSCEYHFDSTLDPALDPDSDNRAVNNNNCSNNNSGSSSRSNNNSNNNNSSNNNSVPPQRTLPAQSVSEPPLAQVRAFQLPPSSASHSGTSRSDSSSSQSSSSHKHTLDLNSARREPHDDNPNKKRRTSGR